MSGTAWITFSPSICRTRRSVVCVAGCCGPKLSVQTYSRSTGVGGSREVVGIASFVFFHPAPAAQGGASAGAGTASTLISRDSLEVMPFPAPPQRVILAQRVPGKFLGKQNSPQIGVSLKDNAEHVVDFPLEPVGTLPQRDRGGNGQV